MQHVCCKGERTPPKPRWGERFSAAATRRKSNRRLVADSPRQSPVLAESSSFAAALPAGFHRRSRLVGSRSGVPTGWRISNCDQRALLARDLQLVVLGDLSQLPQRPCFQLTDSLLGDAQFRAHLFERLRLRPLREAVAEHDDVLLPILELIEDFQDHLPLPLADQLLAELIAPVLGRMLEDLVLTRAKPLKQAVLGRD